MIRSFADKATQEVFEGGFPAGLPADIVRTARRKLKMVHAAAELRDLRSPPGNRLHPLKGDRDGQFAIRINDQYRVCFTFRDGEAYDVEITDYH